MMAWSSRYFSIDIVIYFWVFPLHDFGPLQHKHLDAKMITPPIREGCSLYLIPYSHILGKKFPKYT